jgi:hypothetical protein
MLKMDTKAKKEENVGKNSEKKIATSTFLLYSPIVFTQNKYI